MKKLVLLALCVLSTIGVASASSEPDEYVPRPLAALPVQSDECPARRRLVEIRRADPASDRSYHDAMRDRFIRNAREPNTTIVLGPNVVLDFSTVPADSLPVQLGRCVTIKRVARFAFAPERPERPGRPGEVRDPRRSTSAGESGSRRGNETRNETRVGRGQP